MAVTTVEGIGSTRTKLHPVQERIAKAHGSQCGFCTPGIVMSMYALLRSIPKPTMENLEIAFQGKITKCPTPKRRKPSKKRRNSITVTLPNGYFFVKHQKIQCLDVITIEENL